MMAQSRCGWGDDELHPAAHNQAVTLKTRDSSHQIISIVTLYFTINQQITADKIELTDSRPKKTQKGRYRKRPNFLFFIFEWYQLVFLHSNNARVKSICF